MPRRCWPFKRIAAVTLGLWLGLFGVLGEARAYEEQLGVDLALGYGALAANQVLPDQLASVDLGASLGLGEWLLARTAFGYGVLVGEDTLHVGRGRLEVGGALDIVQWVPMFGIGAGLWALDGPSGLGLRPEAHLWLGLDYLLSRSWSVGGDLRSGLLWQRGDVASVTEVQFRFTRMFEMF